MEIGLASVILFILATAELTEWANVATIPALGLGLFFFPFSLVLD